MSLSADQVYLLNTLSYISKEDVFSASGGTSVESFARTILNQKSLVDSLVDEFMTGEQIVAVCEQIMQDPILSRMQIAHASRTTGGADRLIITSPPDAPVKEAIVVMEGTTGGVEWRDNFAGGCKTDQADGVSTKEQVDTLDWFQNNPQVQDILDGCDKITVSGHSKGGNRAKYLALFDERIDECISFDGQGFSDEFVQKYAELIQQRQGKVTNYNHQGDYVNILLNDIGENHYIKGQNNGSDFLKNHSLFSLLATMPLLQNETEQWPPMNELDQIMNGFLRTLDDREKKVFLSLLGELSADLMGGDDHLGLDDVLDYAGRLYFDSGLVLMKRFLQYVFKYAGFELIELLTDWFLAVFPGLQNWIDDIRDSAKTIAGVLDGRDIRYALRPNGKDLIAVDSALMSSLSAQIRTMSAQLHSCAEGIEKCAALCEEYHLKPKMTVSVFLKTIAQGKVLMSATPAQALRQLGADLLSLDVLAMQMSNNLKKAADCFDENEKKIIAGIPTNINERPML